MKKYFWIGIGVNLAVTILLTIFLILPRWYYGLGSTPQLILELSLLLTAVGQILSAFIWKIKYNGNVIIGILPILILIWFYIKIASPLFITN